MEVLCTMRSLLSKRRIRPAVLALAAAFLLLLPGCSPIKSPEEAGLVLTVPEPDPEGLVSIGNRVRAPFAVSLSSSAGTEEALTISEYTEALAASGFYYGTWVYGEPSSFTNSEGEEAELYPLQLYLITYEGTDAEDAQAKTAGWLEAARQNYTGASETTLEFNGITWTALSYSRETNETNPYGRGYSVFSTGGETALCAELTAVPEFEGDLDAIMEAFLAQTVQK